MSRFLTRPNLKRLDATDAAGQPLFELRHDLIFELGPEDSKLCVVVPSGRITNLATLPRSRFLRWCYRDIAAEDGRFISAPILHDYLCNETFVGNPDVSGFDRFEAAAFFRAGLRAMGAPRWQSFTAYWAVRANDLWVWLRGKIDAA